MPWHARRTGISAWNISPTNTSPYTIELWARFAVMPGANQMLICRNAGFGNRTWMLYSASGVDRARYSTYVRRRHLTATTVTVGGGPGGKIPGITSRWTRTHRQGPHLCQRRDEGDRTRQPTASSITYFVYPVGNHGLVIPATSFVGNIDDVRITSACRDTATCTAMQASRRRAVSSRTAPDARLARQLHQ